MIERIASILARKRATFPVEAAGYLAVSAVALALDLGVYWLLLGLSLMPALAAVIGYSLGLVVHYLLASRLVFASRLLKRGLSAEAPTFAKYAATGIAGIALTAAIVAIGTDMLSWSAIGAKLVATACAFVAVFLMRRCLVFAMPARPVTA